MKLDGITEKEKKHEARKKAARTAVTLTASAGLLIGGLFSSPAALPDEEELLPGPVYADDADPGSGDDAGEELLPDEEDGEDEHSAPAGARARLRQKLLQLPLILRLLVLLPLWAVGWLIQTGATALWSLLLGPVLGKALGWLLLLAALIGAFLLAAKTVFPDLPLKKLLKRRSLLGLVLGALLLGVADCALPFVWDGYARIGALVRALGIGLVFGTVTLRFVLREHRRRRALPPDEGTEAEFGEETGPAPLTREEILALADSVSRR